jgi:ribonuclease HI
MADFTCQSCGEPFSLPQSVLDQYPGWVPRYCRSCRDEQQRPRGESGGGSARPFDPQTGVFTDGACAGNPGPGGWGAVYVVDGEVIDEAHGFDPDTTNNRMELRALIEGLKLVPEGASITVYSDSNLAVQTINEWASGWEARGWQRKKAGADGSRVPKNLDLVKAAYFGFKARPEVDLQWIKGHADLTWNEYADGLANRWRE